MTMYIQANTLLIYCGSVSWRAYSLLLTVPKSKRGYTRQTETDRRTALTLRVTMIVLHHHNHSSIHTRRDATFNSLQLTDSSILFRETNDLHRRRRFRGAHLRDQSPLDYIPLTTHRKTHPIITTSSTSRLAFSNL